MRLLHAVDPVPSGVGSAAREARDAICAVGVDVVRAQHAAPVVMDEHLRVRMCMRPHMCLCMCMCMHVHADVHVNVHVRVHAQICAGGVAISVHKCACAMLKCAW